MLPILPVVGSSGFYHFGAPFDTLAVADATYTCKAVRRISDYLANNEDAKALVYTAAGLDDAAWDDDSASDAYIASLQSSGGHWLYVPYRYILNYPSVNGIPYRAIMIGVSLPSIPVDQDLTVVSADIKELVEDSLGLGVVVKSVETSRVIQVPTELHLQKEMERNALKQRGMTNHSRIVKLQLENTQLLAKISALEDYIRTKL